MALLITYRVTALLLLQTFVTLVSALEGSKRSVQPHRPRTEQPLQRESRLNARGSHTSAVVAAEVTPMGKAKENVDSRESPSAEFTVPATPIVRLKDRRKDHRALAISSTGLPQDVGHIKVQRDILFKARPGKALTTAADADLIPTRDNPSAEVADEVAEQRSGAAVVLQIDERAADFELYYIRGGYALFLILALLLAYTSYETPATTAFSKAKFRGFAHSIIRKDDLHKKKSQQHREDDKDDGAQNVRCAPVSSKPGDKDNLLEGLWMPEAFRCPISRLIMKDPVTTADGLTYECKCILAWFRLGHSTSPLTNVELPSLEITRNIALRNAIDEFLNMYPALLRQREQQKEELVQLEDRCLQMKGLLAKAEAKIKEKSFVATLSEISAESRSRHTDLLQPACRLLPDEPVPTSIAS